MDNGVFLFVVAARFSVWAITEIAENWCMLLSLRMWVKMLRVSACEEWGFFFGGGAQFLFSYWYKGYTFDEKSM